jgi:two-component system response regulator AtoC
MRELYETIARVAPSLLPVLVMGETGSGKELVARALHEGSSRRGQPLRSVNCGAIPATLLEGTLFGHERGAFTGAERTSKGLFEQAQGGTVFLDEVGELSAQAQAALLRVLETRRITRLGGDREIDVDVRVVAATHRDLEQLCEAGTFRWDLLYRLNAMTLRVPPLRERPEDLGPLVEAFVAEANRTHGRAVRGIEPGAWECVTRHRWPGNVRELRNAVDRAVVIARGERITEEDLPERVRAGAAASAASGRAAGAPTSTASAVGNGAVAGAGEEEGLEYRERLKQHMQRYETELIVEALRKFNGNQTEAARALQMPLRTLAHKIQTYGIKKTFGPK